VNYSTHPDSTVVVPPGWVREPATLAGVDHAVREHLPPEAAGDLGPVRKAWHHRPGGITAIYGAGAMVHWRGAAVQVEGEDVWWHRGRRFTGSDTDLFLGPPRGPRPLM